MRQFLTLLTLLISSTVFSQQTEEVCPQQVTPDGWIVISTRACNGCCGFRGQNVFMKTIKKIDSLPSGTILEICPNQDTPKGWVLISVRDCLGCCSLPQSLQKIPTIKKL